MTLTALVKLSDRFGEAFFPRIAAMLAPYKTSCQLQAQQRACEYSELLREPYAGIREQLLDRMPPLDIDNAKARRADDATGDSEDDDSEEASEEEAPRAARATKPAETSLMDDLLGLDAGAGKSAGGDLLGGDLADVMDIFSAVPAAPTTQPAQAAQQSQQATQSQAEEDPFSFVATQATQPVSPFDILDVASAGQVREGGDDDG